MIYVFRVGQLGDTLVCLPAIIALKKTHPGQQFTLIANMPDSGSVSAWEVLRHTGCFSDVIFYEPRNLLSLFKLLVRIRLSRSARTLYYLSACRSRWQVLRDRVFFRTLCGFREVQGLALAREDDAAKDVSGRLPRVRKQSHRLMDVVCPGSSFRPDPPLLFPGPSEREKIDCLLRCVPPGRRLLALCHGSKMRSKIWPPDRYSALCQQILAHEPLAYFVLFGDKSEYALGETVRKGLESSSVNLCGRSSIIESAAAIHRCEMYIGNDTGVMHLAASMGVSTVSIFSARENPGRWEPYGDRNTVLRKEVDCEGCMLSACTVNNARCLDMISVEEVLQAVLVRLRSTQSSSCPET